MDNIIAEQEFTTTGRRSINDILKVTKGIIVHQVNCQGVMGCGIALAIRQKWNGVYTAYRKKVRDAQLKLTTEDLLGDAQLVNVGKGLYVANIFAQYRYGRDKMYTNYEEFIICLVQLLVQRSKTCPGLDIYFPYKIGCNNAGGDWNVIEEIIKNLIPDAIIVRKH